MSAQGGNAARGHEFEGRGPRCLKCGDSLWSHENPEPLAATTPVWSECQACGYRVPQRIKEIEWELLTRCPECGAYDWRPFPEKVGAS